MGWHVLGDLLFLLVSAVAVAAVLERLGISAVVGYLLGGMLVGPGVLGFVGASEGGEERYAVMTELGVSLLLFTIGLEITPGKLKLFGIRGGLIGLAQVIVTVIAGFGAVLLIRDLSYSTAFAIACMMTLSSTAVVVRLLSDRTELDSPFGRDALSILLVQDLAVVPMLIIVSLLGSLPPNTVSEEPSISSITFGKLIGVGILVLVTVFVLPRLLGSSIFRRNRDFPVILALATALTAAWASHALGLSAELGAFVAGIILARTDFARQLRADVQVLKAVFLTLFFASVGLLADLDWVFSDMNWASVILFCAIGITLKTLIVAGIVVLSGGRIRSGVRTGLTIAQIGEFSFVVASVALSRGLVHTDGFQMVVSATVLSLLATPGLVVIAKPAGIAVEGLFAKMGIGVAKPRGGMEEALGHSDHVVVAGYGPSGEEAARTAHLAGLETVVIDLNPQLVARSRAEGFESDIGNCAQREILEHARINTARAIIITIPDPAAVIATIEQARALSSDVLIVVRARYGKLLPLYEKAGADHVVSEEEVVGTILGSMIVSMVTPDTNEES
jgi:CPA2 family monovalent cation:H+ antiporter-2